MSNYLSNLDLKMREFVFIALFLISVVTGAVGIYYTNVINNQNTQHQLENINNKLTIQSDEMKSVKKDVGKIKIALVKTGVIDIEDVLEYTDNFTKKTKTDTTIIKPKQGICVGEDTYVKASDWNIE